MYVAKVSSTMARNAMTYYDIGLIVPVVWQGHGYSGAGTISYLKLCHHVYI